MPASKEVKLGSAADIVGKAAYAFRRIAMDGSAHRRQQHFTGQAGSALKIAHKLFRIYVQDQTEGLGGVFPLVEYIVEPGRYPPFSASAAASKTGPEPRLHEGYKDAAAAAAEKSEAAASEGLRS
jgi:hypothetical protein